MNTRDLPGLILVVLVCFLLMALEARGQRRPRILRLPAPPSPFQVAVRNGMLITGGMVLVLAGALVVWHFILF